MSRNAMSAGKTEQITKNIPLYMGLVIAGAFLLRLVGIQYRPFYVDEAVTLFISSRPLPDILPFMMQINEVHPPVYFYLVRIWASLWTAPWTAGPFTGFMRLSSVLFGVLSIPLCFLFTRELYDEKTALWTSVLLSFSSFHLFYSQELRMYPFLLFLFMASFLLFFSFLRKPRVISAIGLIAVNGLMLLTHYFGVFPLVIQLIFGIGLLFHLYAKKPEGFSMGESGLSKTVDSLSQNLPAAAVNLKLTALVSVLSSAPFFIWIPFFLKQTHHQDFTLRRNPGPAMLMELFSRLAYGETIIQPQWGAVNFFIVAAILPICLIIWGLVKDRGPGPITAGLYLTVPLAVTMLAGLTRFHIFEFKYFFVVLPAFWMLTVRGILNLRKIAANEMIIGVFLLINGFTIFNFLSNPYFMGQNWRGAAGFVADRAAQGESVILHPSMMSLPFLYQFRGRQEVIPMDMPDSRIGPLMAKNRPIWLVSTVNHPFVQKAGLVVFFKHNMEWELSASFKSYNPADEIGVYYFRPRQKEKK